MPPRTRRRHAARRTRLRRRGSDARSDPSLVDRAGASLAPRPRGTTSSDASPDGSIRGATAYALGPVRSVSVLLGAAISLTTVGLIARFERVFATDVSGGAAVAGLVLGVVFVALAVGMRVPRRFALWACSIARRKLRHKRGLPDPSDDSLRPHDVDRPLGWMLLAVTALIAGVLTALLPIGMLIATTSYGWMLRHFVWSNGPLVALQILTLLLAAALPLALFGSATSGVHRLSCPVGGWEPSATGWILVGAGIGAMMGGAILRSSAPPNLLLLSAALPMLAITLLATFRSAVPNDGPTTHRVPSPTVLPMSSDTWPRLLRGALVTVGVCGFAAAMVWVSFDAAGGYPGSIPTAAALLLATGTGTLAGCRRRSEGERTIGGFGAACAGAGVTIALGLSLPAGSSSISTAFVRLPVACVSIAAVAYAAAYGRRTLLGRVAQRPLAGTTIMTRTFAGCALLIWVIAPLVAAQAKRQATLLGVALTLLALGGTLIIHEPVHSPGKRRIRLCAVFASIGAMITIVLIRS